jgi:hypothetical protein
MEDISTGGYGPVAICDMCGRRITDAEKGTAAWVALDEMPTYFDFVTIHDDACYDRFEERDGPYIGDIPLPAFLIYFERGLNLNREDAEKQALALSH